MFVPALEDDQEQSDLEVETIEDMGRIRSDLQTISGSFTPPSEGVIFFLWDNTYVINKTNQFFFFFFLRVETIKLFFLSFFVLLKCVICFVILLFSLFYSLFLHHSFFGFNFAVSLF